MIKPVKIKRIYLDHVISSPLLFNTNNHYNDEKVDRPDDYCSVIAKGNTCNWIDKFHTTYRTITLDNQDLDWAKKCYSEIGCITRKFSKLYEDEIQETVEKHQHKMPEGEWFVRTDSVSLKEGVHGIGPYSSLRKILESMVSSGIGHNCFDKDDTSCTIYFLPWVEINPFKEFRIFVYQNEITAISYQHLYKINEWLNTLSDSEIIDLVNGINDYFEKHIKDKMSYMTNYTMDLALIGSDETPYFIEPNSFGKYYAAGSALYSWVYDHDTLHESDEIEFRYCHEY